MTEPVSPLAPPDLDDRDWQVPAFTVAEFAPRRTDACIVIPVINEGPRVRNLLTRMRAQGLPERADILIIDGGSTDGSLAEDFLRSVGVRALLVKTGPGRLGAQLRCAYAYALRQGYDGIVTIDGNDKDDPDPIPQFLDDLRAGFDFVQASRFLAGGVAENTPWVRTIAIRAVHAPVLSLASGMRWTDTTQGFRAYSRRLLLHPGLKPFRDIFSGYELLAYMNYRAPRLGMRCVERPTARRYPKGEVPTKISAVRGNAKVLRCLIDAALGRYDPLETTENL
jgi:glycosyltransferase involved in cell wall biosynthesis